MWRCNCDKDETGESVSFRATDLEIDLMQSDHNFPAVSNVIDRLLDAAGANIKHPINPPTPPLSKARSPVKKQAKSLSVVPVTPPSNPSLSKVSPTTTHLFYGLIESLNQTKSPTKAELRGRQSSSEESSPNHRVLNISRSLFDTQNPEEIRQDEITALIKDPCPMEGGRSVVQVAEVSRSTTPVLRPEPSPGNRLPHPFSPNPVFNPRAPFRIYVQSGNFLIYSPEANEFMKNLAQQNLSAEEIADEFIKLAYTEKSVKDLGKNGRLHLKNVVRSKVNDVMKEMGIGEKTITLHDTAELSD